MPDILTSHTGTLTTQLEQFRAELGVHYEEAHFILACHAAFPAFITPDLLYQLWANFKSWPDRQGRMQMMPALTVSDVLLSSLFRITGPDLYEMKPEVSAALVRYLATDPRFGPDRIKALASFLYQYALSQPNKPGLHQYREAQQWMALMALNPALATEKLLKSLMEKAGNQQVNQSLGIMNLMEGFAHGNEEFTHELSARLQPTSAPLPHMATIETVPDSDFHLTEIVILDSTMAKEDIMLKVELPAYVSERLDGMRKGANEVEVEKSSENKHNSWGFGKIRAILIGVSEFSNKELHTLIGPVEDVMNLSEYLLHGTYPILSCTNLVNEKATSFAVTSATIEALLQLNEGESLLIYFSGMTGQSSINKQKGIVLYDYYREASNQLQEGLLTPSDFRNLVQRYNRQNAMVTMVLDCDYCGTDWLPITDNYVTLMATYPEKYARENPKGGFFSQAFMHALRQSDNLTVKELFKNILLYLDDIKPALHQTPLLLLPPGNELAYFLGKKQIRHNQIDELLIANGYETSEGTKFIQDHLLRPNDDLRLFLSFKYKAREYGGTRIIAFLSFHSQLNTKERFLERFSFCGSIEMHPIEQLKNMLPYITPFHVVFIVSQPDDSPQPGASLLRYELLQRCLAFDLILVNISLEFYHEEFPIPPYDWHAVWGPTFEPTPEIIGTSPRPTFHIRTLEELSALALQLQKFTQHLVYPIKIESSPQFETITLPPPITPDTIDKQDPQVPFVNRLLKGIRNLFRGNDADSAANRPNKKSANESLSGDADDDDDEDDDDDDDDIDMEIPTPDLPLMK